MATIVERIDACCPELKIANIAKATTRRVAIIPVKSKYFSELVIREGIATIQCTTKLTPAQKRIAGIP